MTELNYLPASEVSEVSVDAEHPRNPYPSGYGRKIPTRYRVKIANRWHRVYMMQYGNSGAPYVIRKGQTWHLSTDVESMLEEATRG